MNEFKCFYTMVAIRIFSVAILSLFVHCLQAQQHAYIPIPEKNMFLRGVKGSTTIEDCRDAPAMIVGGDTMVLGKQWIAIRDTNCIGDKSEIHTLWRQDSISKKVWTLNLFEDTTYAEEHLLMNFSLSEGDTFETVWDTYVSGSNRVTLEVISIDSIFMLDNKWHYRQKLHAINSPLEVYGGSYGWDSDTFVYAVEGLGILGNSYFLQKYRAVDFLWEPNTLFPCIEVNGILYFSQYQPNAQLACDKHQLSWDGYLHENEINKNTILVARTDAGVSIFSHQYAGTGHIIDLNGQCLWKGEIKNGYNFINLTENTRKLIIINIINGNHDILSFKVF